LLGGTVRDKETSMKYLAFLLGALTLVVWGCQTSDTDRMLDRASGAVRSQLGLNPGQAVRWDELVTAPTLDQTLLRASVDARFARVASSRTADLDLLIPDREALS